MIKFGTPDCQLFISCQGIETVIQTEFN